MQQMLNSTMAARSIFNSRAGALSTGEAAMNAPSMLRMAFADDMRAAGGNDARRNEPANASAGTWNKRGIHRSASRLPTSAAVTVRDIVVPTPVRLAEALLQASIIRDVAAFGALVVFATMLTLLWQLEPAVRPLV